MADAKKSINYKEVVVTETVEEEMVDLRLTKDEAVTLISILNRVGGYDGVDGHRHRSDAIYAALSNAGTQPKDIVKTGMILKS